MRVRRQQWLLAAALVVGLAAGAAWPPPPLPKLAANGDEWGLPSATDVARYFPQDMAAVTSGLRWKGEVGGAAGARSAWRLAGIVNDAGPAVLVMTPDDQGKVQRVAIGETLPDGSVLQSARGDRATTRRDACITTYQLFQAQAVDISGECEETEVPDQGTNE
ncbi:hypothetical protein CQ393_15880 [Stenotrophomonas sp. MYb238]|uniref:hypothetical protein n=1 Tax=Stenotrophomonas sp. MYb238 TaxID=2040281 RepID=UPI001290A9F9|nr:hypothetical protein [Stenotrophomonas sp. MYb238]MQP77359.1 hypothetical protein [Stenotrophomonas sp. MYb238]